MIKKFLSHYRPRYVRSLAYMLQSSEYDIGEYLSWFHRVKDFSSVEKRKELKKTNKAIVIQVISWMFLLAIVSIAFYMFTFSTTMGYGAGILTLILAPYLLAYGIIIPLLILKFFVQNPLEYVIIRRARNILAKHKGIKIAIAGSFGKTSMREMLRVVLSEEKLVAAPPHSYNTPLGISNFINTLTGNEEVLIFELGEYYPGDVRKLCALVQPDIGFITGVNEAHLQKFKTIDKTVSTIFELADYLKDKPTYVNGESEFAKKNSREGHFVYDRHGVGQLKTQNLHTDLGGTSFTLVHEGSELEISSSLLGLHQVGPLVAVADVAFSLGISEEGVKSGISKTKPFAHRLDPSYKEGGVVVLDDSYNGNPDGVRAVIDFLATLKGRRRFYVTPGLVEMGKQTEFIHKNIGIWLAEAEIEQVVLIRNSVTPYIEQGLKSANYQGVISWFDDAVYALSSLSLMTAEGDVVLLQNDWPDQYA